ncbi:hypothetical protein BKA61DRAFT_584810 [Leptodontidium sp. MPI-SDFR-AT-0119]|nr:hypothetical protein BKA61DRAFT_584810 [Leptodontidium sp. MPI-SDFR-AT-0119]
MPSRSSQQLEKFIAKVQHIRVELGQWASDYYMSKSIQKFIDAAEAKQGMPLYKRNREDEILLSHLKRLQCSCSTHQIATAGHQMAITKKVQKLIDFLTTRDEAQRHGIIFAEQRATVAMLSNLLTIHPKTKDIVRCGTFVGSSNNSERKAAIGDWLDSSEQQDTLEEFRLQHKNLIIATSVLEEGIDISACNVVICFNKPANLKSFIQRRGRARKHNSKYVLMLSLDDVALNCWDSLEQMMVELYQKDVAEREDIRALEDVEEFSDSRFEVESTGALLTLDTAMAHIHHFCATLPPQPYVDLRPAFHIREEGNGEYVAATITLPNCVDPLVRTASSSGRWKTERMAKKDAAFQCYIALYKEGLVNDNLLPLLGGLEEPPAGVETRCALEDVSVTCDPWEDISRDWSAPMAPLYRNRISIDRPGQPPLALDIVLPREIAFSSPYTLYWDEQTPYTISLGDPLSVVDVNATLLPIMRRVTATILQPVYGRRMTQGADDFLALFLPSIETRNLASWLGGNAGSFPVSQLLEGPVEAQYGLIREPSLNGAPHIFTGPAVDDSIKVIALPKRRDFLRPGYVIRYQDEEIGGDGSNRRFQFVPVHSSMVERLSLEHCLATDLSGSVLRGVGFVDVGWVITATNAPAANETTNYQTLEFIGDSLLKYLVSLNLYLSHPSWPEGYLSRARDRIVANSRLARAAVEMGIDRYIVTNTFTAKKWRPACISDYTRPGPDDSRTMSTKVLADVVEALVGGAFLDGGLARASLCASRLLPEVTTSALDWDACSRPDYEGEKSIIGLEDLESLLGYRFRDRRLLREALTHPSCENDAETSSYQRLEFIGDAVLDMIVVSYLVDHAPQLSHGRMHLIKAATVNASFLAHICLNACVEQSVKDIRCVRGTNFKQVHGSRQVKMCQFMRHQNSNVLMALNTCLKQHSEIANEIEDCLEHGPCYPWVLLTSLEPEKFLSDMVESIFGAILIDARGNREACTATAENLGIYKYLRRIVAEDIDLLHPKNKLGELAGNSTVEYESGVQDDKNSYSCKVIVGGREIASVFDGSSKDDAITRAADAAIRCGSLADRTEKG